MDATYWGRYFGIVVIKDAFRNKVLWYKFIRGHERVEDYVEGVDWLKSHGLKIWGIVCDGLKGLFESIKRHVPWLWTFKKFKDRTIPNTNTGIESFNSRLKTTLRIHSGITAERRMKLIENFIATHY